MCREKQALETMLTAERGRRKAVEAQHEDAKKRLSQAATLACLVLV